MQLLRVGQGADVDSVCQRAELLEDHLELVELHHRVWETRFETGKERAERYEKENR